MRELTATTLFRLDLALLVLLGIGASIPVAAIIVLAPVVVCTVVTIGFIAAALRRWSRRPEAIEDMRTRLEEYRPSFLIHYSGPARGVHQVTMWLPYFDRVGAPYVIVVRERHSLASSTGPRRRQSSSVRRSPPWTPWQCRAYERCST